MEWVRRCWKEERKVSRGIEERDREVQQQEGRRRIDTSRWNKWYKMVRTIEIPKYLREKGKEERMKRVARFRLGYERRDLYWVLGEKGTRKV